MSVEAYSWHRSHRCVNRASAPKGHWRRPHLAIPRSEVVFSVDGHWRSGLIELKLARPPAGLRYMAGSAGTLELC